MKRIRFSIRRITPSRHQRHQRALKKGPLMQFKSTEVKYHLSTVTEKIMVWDEEKEREVPKTIVLRPQMQVTTYVNRVKNRFGLIKLYGPQGVRR